MDRIEGWVVLMDRGTEGTEGRPGWGSGQVRPSVPRDRGRLAPTTWGLWGAGEPPDLLGACATDMQEGEARALGWREVKTKGTPRSQACSRTPEPVGAGTGQDPVRTQSTGRGSLGRQQAMGTPGHWATPFPRPPATPAGLVPGAPAFPSQTQSTCCLSPHDSSPLLTCPSGLSPPSHRVPASWEWTPHGPGSPPNAQPPPCWWNSFPPHPVSPEGLPKTQRDGGSGSGWAPAPQLLFPRLGKQQNSALIQH